MVALVVDAGGPVGDGVPAPEPVAAAVLIHDPDLRLLVRGVLTLERCPVVVDGSGEEFFRLLGRPERETLLLFDAGDGRDGWREELSAALRHAPELLPIVLLPVGGQGLVDDAERLGAKATLVRPLVLKELVRAIHSVALGRQ